VRPYVLDGPPGLGDDLRDLRLPAGVHVEKPIRRPQTFTDQEIDQVMQL
jgi:hypothetical protein